MRSIGLVGFGSVAQNSHLPAWQALPGVLVGAIADISDAGLERARVAVPDAELYDSPEEMIARADVDVIDICTPPSTHVDLILAACTRGIPNIVCEKPLVLTEQEYARVAEARIRAGNRVVGVNNWVHSDLNNLVTEALDSDAIGAVERVELTIGRPDCALGNAGWMPRWRTDLTHAGGGIILDHGWHQLYLLMGWISQPIVTVSATTRTVDNRHYPVEDEASIQLSFVTAEASIELSWAAAQRTNEGVIRGSRGLIKTFDDRVIVDNEAGRRDVPFSSRTSQSSYHPHWFEAVFRDTVIGASRAEADRNFAESGVLVSTIRAAYRSAEQGGAPCRLCFALDGTHNVAAQGEIGLTHGRGRSRGDSP